MRLMVRILPLVTIVSIVVTVLAGCGPVVTENTPDKVTTVATGPEVGKLAPEFKYADAKGKTVSLSNLRGKTVMLNFWASWCGPCKYEMPLLQALAGDKDKAAQGLILLTVNDGESFDTVGQFMTANGYSFTVLLDTQNVITRSYNIRAIPTTFFIGQDGIIRNVKVGAFMNQTELGTILNRVIK